MTTTRNPTFAIVDIETNGGAPTPDGRRPQLKMEGGRFAAYRFNDPEEEAEWVPDRGSSRIDAILDRHFAGHAASVEVDRAAK